MHSPIDSDARETPPEGPASAAGSDGSPKAGDIIVYKGRPATVCENGALIDVETHRFVKPGHLWTSTTGRQAIVKRHEDAKRRAEDAMVQEAKQRGLDANTGPEVFGIMVGTLAGDVLDKQGRLGDRTAATRFVGRVTDITPDPKARLDQNTAAEITVRMTAEAWKAAAEILARRGTEGPE